MKFLVKMMVLIALLNQGVHYLQVGKTVAAKNVTGKLQAITQWFNGNQTINHKFAQNKLAASHYYTLKKQSVDKEDQWVYDTLAFIKEADNCAMVMDRLMKGCAEERS